MRVREPYPVRLLVLPIMFFTRGFIVGKQAAIMPTFSSTLSHDVRVGYGTILWFRGRAYEFQMW